MEQHDNKDANARKLTRTVQRGFDLVITAPHGGFRRRNTIQNRHRGTRNAGRELTCVRRASSLSVVSDRAAPKAKSQSNKLNS